MDPITLRNHIINLELNSEYEVLKREIEHVVQSGFQKLLGYYKRLHVSNIPFSFREIDLIALFQPFGPVFEAEIIFNERGSKGFGFLTMYQKDADVAFENLNNCVISGRRIEINNATPRKSSVNKTPQHERFMLDDFTQTTPHQMQVFTHALTPPPVRFHFTSPHNSSQNYSNMPSRARPFKSRCNLFPQL